jgi:hypothetical protein
MIGLKCPKCQTVMKVDESKAGSSTTCPGCGGAFRIPNLTRPKQGGAQGVRGQGPGARGQGATPSRTTPEKQTAIQRKTSKPPADPSVRPARTSPISPAPSPPEEEEFEYTLEDIHEEEAPPPPPRKRPRIEIEDEDDEVEDDLDEEGEEDEEEEDEQDDEDEEDEEGEDPRVRRKKKKKSGGMSPIPFVAGGIIFVIVAGCTFGGYILATRKKPPPDPAKAMEMVKARGGNFKQDETDPAKPVIEVSLMGTDADNGDLDLLRAFPKLKKLDLTRCTKINNVGLEWLEDFKEIRVLKLGFCSHVTDGGMEFVGKLTSLEELYLDQTNVTDRGLSDLKGLKSLKKLSLSGAMLASGRGLQAAIPGLEIIQ